MLLFLFGIGMDVPTVATILILLVLSWFLVFYVSRAILRKTVKEASAEKIKRLSRVSAFILSPVLLIGACSLLVYIMIEMTPKLSPEEEAIQYYEMMDQSIQEDLKVGMSKMDVLELLGDTDTTQSAMIYDMSLPEAKDKYVVEINFENGRLSNFRKRQ